MTPAEIVELLDKASNLVGWTAGEMWGAAMNGALDAATALMELADQFEGATAIWIEGPDGLCEKLE